MLKYKIIYKDYVKKKKQLGIGLHNKVTIHNMSSMSSSCRLRFSGQRRSPSSSGTTAGGSNPRGVPVTARCVSALSPFNPLRVAGKAMK